MKRITWEQFFMAQCSLLAVRSTCTRLAVGAVIVRDNRIIAGGYNGSVSGGDHCIDNGCYVVDNHCIRTIHAEMNALLQCGKYGIPAAGSTLYVTHFPCLQCSKAIIQAGISKVYYGSDYKNSDYAIELFNHAGIDVEHIPFDERTLDFELASKQELVQDMLYKMQHAGISENDLNSFSERAQQLFGN
ncbi:ComE operon protein 2 [Sporosarcina aquimarina]|uniref:ComE operon protein 2 n=1 Tax=Sporosarcina aquimarina TaxID=114975 RepID=A0ABU4FWB8_9BACL|nr:ComE operon protein 2 [Sporosarcina aquimarina]MDW0109005.1 ComE operon protein 2 [Sporosarcina aquimarina]